jgi:catechol 2,3-dioxygenase-like lactoylglutathione lyase family enzyme
LPALGFIRQYHEDEWSEWRVWAATEPPLPATQYFGITESPDHVPNENRIAFWVFEPAEVDRIASVVKSAGARDLSGPKPMPYGPDYYAVFFADRGGNRLEVYFRQAG